MLDWVLIHLWLSILVNFYKTVRFGVEHFIPSSGDFKNSLKLILNGNRQKDR